MFNPLKHISFLWSLTLLLSILVCNCAWAQPYLLPEDNNSNTYTTSWPTATPGGSDSNQYMKDDYTFDYNKWGQDTQITSSNQTSTTSTTKNESGTSITRGDNSSCNIADMQKMYQSTCYSCKIILTLITSFMNACSKVYDLSREAGSKILVIGSLLWLAAFALKLVSAFTNQEPMQIVNTLFTFMFKVAVAYIVMNAGIGAIIDLFINPLLGAGADYGLGLLQAANQGLINIPASSSFPYNGVEIIDSNVINKIMALTEGIDKTVSTNLVIGHALTCHSFNAGMITLVDKEALGVSITLRIPDFWVWICGAAIWFSGFMLTLGVGYYLLDVCFKIGFCIIALPIVIGLWPFGPTSGKFSACMSIIFRSAALFAFLALLVSYALSLISTSLGDLTTFYAKINAGDAEWISNMFSIFSASFILIIFAYLYSIKLIGTVTEYTGKFFGDSVFGSASPIHGKATQMTDFLKKKAMQPVQYAGGVVAHQTTRAVGAVAAAPINFVKNRFNKAKNSSKGTSGSGAGATVASAGRGMESAGQGMETAGQGMETAGKGMKAAGQGISSVSQAANAIPIAGQVVAAAGAAAGAAVQAAGTATQVAGKATQAAGKVTKAAGKVTQSAGDAIQTAEDAVNSNSNNENA